MNSADGSAPREDVIRQLDQGLTGALGITCTRCDDLGVVMHMPVDARTKQPFGLVHGGAFAALAETVASVGGLWHVDFPRQVVVGQQVSLNLLRSAREGLIRAEGRLVHKGTRTQVWDVEMVREMDEVTAAVARITLAVVDQT